MGDMREDFDIMKRDARERREKRRRENMAAIDASGITYEVRPSALLFREAGEPKADFYPGTGRWRVCGEAQTRRGGARAFLAWYQREAGRPPIEGAS